MTQTAPDTAGTSAGVRAGAREWTALAVLMLPVLLVSIDNTALSFALPDIARELRPTAQEQLWIVDAYPLVLAALLVAAGNLGDRVGRKRLLIIGASGFGIASIAAAFAPTAELLIAARVLLGLFGATLMPSTLSLLRSTFVDRQQRRLAIAIWATAFSVGSAIGPIVGGLLLAHFHWGSIFLIAVPVLAPLLVLAPFVIRESRDPHPGPIDIASIVLSMLALGALAAGIKHVATAGPDLAGLALALVAIGAGWWFVHRMRRAASPMLDVGLLRVPEFSGGIMVNLFSVISLTGFLFFVTQHLQLVEGLAVIDAALVLAPGVVATVLMGLSVVWIVKRVRPGTVITIALLCSVAAYTTLAILGSDVSVLGIALAFTLIGLGLGAAETLSNDLIIAAVPADKAGAASAVSETAYELGAVLGTAVLGGALTAAYRGSLDVPAGVTASDAAAAAETLGGAVSVAESLPAALGDALLAAAREAFDTGVVVTSIAGAVMLAMAAVVAAITLRRARA